MTDKIIAYISKNGEVKETKTFCLGNFNQYKELIWMLYSLPQLMERGMRVTFSAEV